MDGRALHHTESDIAQILEQNKLRDMRALTEVIHTPTPWDDVVGNPEKLQQGIEEAMEQAFASQPGMQTTLGDFIMGPDHNGEEHVARRAAHLRVLYPDPGQLIDSIREREVELTGRGELDDYQQQLVRDSRAPTAMQKVRARRQELMGFIQTETRMKAYERILEILYGERYERYKDYCLEQPY